MMGLNIKCYTYTEKVEIDKIRFDGEEGFSCYAKTVVSKSDNVCSGNIISLTSSDPFSKTLKTGSGILYIDQTSQFQKSK